MNQPAMSNIITMAMLFQPRIDILHRLSYIMLYLYDISEYTVLCIYIYTHELMQKKLAMTGRQSIFWVTTGPGHRQWAKLATPLRSQPLFFCAVGMGLGVRHKRSISEIVIPNM